MAIAPAQSALGLEPIGGTESAGGCGQPDRIRHLLRIQRANSD